MDPVRPVPAGPPEPPAGFCFESCFAGVRWHHRWELFRGLHTPGPVDVAELCRNIGLPEDLSGQRVLDIGGWHGCVSFECERRGAGEVVCYSLENPHASGFHRIRSLLGSAVDYVQGSVYELHSRTDLGRFDVVLLLGVLYHLRHPLLALDRLRTVCSRDLYLETHVIDHCLVTRTPGSNPHNAGDLPEPLGDIPLWRQYAAYELHPEDASNWFGPNRRAVVEALESAGFEVDRARVDRTRGFFRARALGRPPERLSSTYEAVSRHDAELSGIPPNDEHALYEPVDLPVPADGALDSRQPRGLFAELDVELDERRAPVGGRLRGRARVTNTGSATWLPESAGAGAVRLGVDAYDAQGAFATHLPSIPLPPGDRAIRPGEQVQVEFAIDATRAGSWQLDFDLYAHEVVQFQFRTDMPRRFRVEVY